MSSEVRIYSVYEFIEAIRRNLSSAEGDLNPWQLKVPDYVPPVILSPKAEELITQAVGCMLEGMTSHDNMSISSYYQDGRDPVDCCVVVTLQQMRENGPKSVCVESDWLDRYGEIRDQLLASSIGMGVHGSESGLEFEIRIPVYRQKPQAVQHRNTILLVEDDDLVLAATKEVLEFEGYFVEDCRTAEEAVAFLGRGAGCVKLVISDLRLPGGDGRDLARKVHSTLREVPVLLTSGYGLMVEEEPQHHTFYLSKPYNSESLLIAVRRCLQVYQQVPLSGIQQQKPAPVNAFC